MKLKQIALSLALLAGSFHASVNAEVLNNPRIARTPETSGVRVVGTHGKQFSFFSFYDTGLPYGAYFKADKKGKPIEENRLINFTDNKGNSVMINGVLTVNGTGTDFTIDEDDDILKIINLVKSEGIASATINGVKFSIDMKKLKPLIALVIVDRADKDKTAKWRYSNGAISYSANDEEKNLVMIKNGYLLFAFKGLNPTKHKTVATLTNEKGEKLLLPVDSPKSDSAGCVAFTTYSNTPHDKKFLYDFLDFMGKSKTVDVSVESYEIKDVPRADLGMAFDYLITEHKVLQTALAARDQ
ncbi:MAG: hypothetical protein ACRCVE_13360 [Plesiomonas sp.]